MVTMVKINLRGTKGIVSSHEVTAGKHAATVLQVPHSGKYNIELIDEATGHAPQVVSTKRVGNNLVLFFDGGDEGAPDVILQDYYDNDGVHLIGQAENGQYYEYIPTSGDVADYPPAMIDGQESQVALGGDASSIADPVADGNNFAWLPFLLLGGAAAGIAGIAYAASDDDDGSSHSKPPMSVTINPATDADKDGRPELSGTSSSPDSTVTITLPDGTTLTTTTDKDGNWTVEAPTAQPNGTITVTVTASDGSTATVTGSYEDTTAPEIPTLTQNDDGGLAGTAEPGSKVTITDPDNGTTTTVTADEDGNWSIQPNPISEGDKNVTIVAEDPAGNVSPPLSIDRPDLTAPDNITSGIVAGSIALTDDVAPVTGVIADGSVTNDTRPTYSGKVTADIDHVNIYDNGTLVSSVAVKSDGSWSYTPTTSLAEGSTHEYTVSAVDKGGNEGPQVSGTADSSWSFTVDTIAPDNTTSGIVDGSEGLNDDVGPVTGPIADGGTTDDARPTFTGQATDDIDHVNIYDNGNLIGSVPVDSDGNWSFTPDTDLTEGNHSLTVSAVDKAGNEGPQTSGTDDGSWDFIVDTTAPDNTTSGIVSGSLDLLDDVGTVVGSIADGSTTDDTRPTYNGKVTADIDHVNIYDNGTLIGSAPVDAEGNWSFTPETDLAAGNHAFTAAAVDKAGLEGPQVSGTDDAAWNFTLETNAPGTGVFEGGSITLTDDVAPVIGTIADGSSTNDTRPTYAGTITAEGLASGVTSVNIYDNGTKIGSAAVDQTSGAWSFTPETDLSAGSHAFTVAAVNNAGIEGAQVSGTDDAAWDFLLDTTAPDNITSGIVDGSLGLTDDVGPVTGPIADGDTTDDTRPTFAGQATDDIDHVNIYDNGNLIGSVPVDENGNWSYTPETDLAEGDHSLTVAAVDKAGNEGPQTSGTDDGSWDFTVDTTVPDNITSGIVDGSLGLTDDVGPVTGPIADGDTTDDSRPTFAGQATDDIDHVNIYDNGNLIGSAPVDADGNWSYTPETDLAEGDHSLTVAAVDKAGQEGPQTSGTDDGSWDFTVDTTAPDNTTSGIVDGSLGLTDDVGPVTGPIADGGTTDDTRPTFAGQATDDIDHVNIYDNGNLIGSAPVDENGNWSYTPETDLAEGDHSLTVAAVDKAGQEGPQVSGTDDGSWDFTVDTTAPDNTTSGIVSGSLDLVDDVGTVTGSIADGSVTDDTRPTYTGKATADIDHVNIYDNGTLIGSAPVDENGNWSFTPETELAAGDHAFTAAAVDKAGLEGPQISGTDDAAWNFTLDTTAPDNITSGIVDGSLGLTDDVGPVTGPIADGGTTDDTRPTFAGQATDDIDHVNIYDNGNLIGSAPVDENGNWSYTPDTDLAEGEHSLTVAAVDKAGQEGPQVSGTDDGSWDFTVDTTAPDNTTSGIVSGSLDLVDDVGTVTGSIADGSVTDDTRPTYTGKATADIDHVNIYDNGTLIGSAPVDENGNWSFTPETGLAAGDHAFTAAAVDKAGLEGPQVSGTDDAAWNFTLDTTAPDNITSGIVSGSLDLVDDVGTVTGSIADGSVTDDTRPTYTGKATADIDHVNIYDNGTLIGSAPVDENGNWSYTPETGLAAGDHAFTAAAVDKAGLEGPQVSGTDDAAWNFTLDTNVPDNITSGIVDGSLGLTDDVGPVTGPIADGGTTDDTRPTYTGTATADIDHVNIYDNGTLIGSAPVDENGNWSFTPETDLAEGDHSLTVAAVNKAGQEGPQTSGTDDGSWDFTVDTTAPDNTTSGIVSGSLDLVDDVGTVTGSIADGSVTDDTRPTYTGKATADIDHVNIYDNGTLIGSAPVDENGNWSFTPETGLAAGDHAFTAAAVDKAGLEGPQVSGTDDAAWNFTLDTTAPDNITSGIVDGSLGLTDDVGPVTGPIADGGTTDDTRPTFAGQATDDIDHVNIYDNGNLIGSAPVDENGNWSYTPETDLAEGDHSLTVAAVDKAGQEGPQVSGTDDGSWDFTVDTTAPDNITSGIVEGSITLTDDVGPVTGSIADGSVTDDARPTYAGKVTADIDHVNIYDNGSLIGSAPVDENGTWSFTPDNALASGGHGLTVSAVDAAGNEGPQVSGTADDSWDFTLLTSAPAQPSIENIVDDYTQGEDADTGTLQKGQATNDATLTLNGSGAPGLTVQIWATDSDNKRVMVGEGTVGEDSRWSITTSALGADGIYNLTATAVNAAGVSSAETGVFPIELDTTLPAAAVAVLNDDQGDVQGVVAADGVTDDRSPTLSGTGEAGATVSVYLDGSNTAAGSVVVGDDGTWSLALATLSDGAHSYQTKITDKAGNETRGEVVNFTVDSSAVVLTIDQANDDAGPITGAVLNGGMTDDTSPELQGTTTAGATVTIKDADNKVLGTAVADADGKWTFPLSNVADGEHTWTAEVTGSTGNTAQATITLTVDSTAPAAPVITAMVDDVGTVQGTSTVSGSVTDDPAPTFSGTADAGTTITIYDGDNVLGTVVANKDGEWSYTPTTNLVDGEHTITVTSTDTVGNESAHSPAWDFTLDTSTDAPVIITNTTDEISGTAEPGATVTITDPSDNSETSVVADEDGKWSIQPNPLETGDTGATVVVTDAAGNTNSTIVDGPSDTTPPDNITSGIVNGSISLTDDVAPVTGTIADGSSTNDARPTYAGQATADIDHVNIYDNGILIGSAPVGEDGTWSFTPETDLAAGDHVFTVSAVDSANNEGPQVSGTSDEGWNFTLDTTPPGADAFEEGSITLTDNVGPIQGSIDDGSTTDDAQPTYAGKITAAGLADGVVSVNIYDNGTLIGSAPVDQTTGVWSFTPGSAMDSGDHALTVSAVDAAGNEGPQTSGTADESWDFSLLTSAPAQPSIESINDDYTQGEDADIGYLQKGQSTNDSTLTVNGTAGAGMTVQIWATDSSNHRVQVGEGQVNKDGRWSITTSELGDDGTYTLTATAVNAAGVPSAETGGFPIILDTVAPDVAVAALMDNEGDKQGEIAPGETTDDRSPTLTGTGEAGATVSVYLDGSTTPVGNVVVDAEGNWTLSLGTLTDGEHSYKTKITDAAGNETQGEVVNFTVDSSAVELTIDQANDDAGTITGAVLTNGLTDDTSPQLQGTATPGATVTIKDEANTVLGTAVANASGQWTFQLDGVTDGTHTWTAETTNAANNTAQATITLTIDSTPPAAPVITSLGDDVGTVQFTSKVQGNMTDDPAPTLTGTAEAGSTVTIYDGTSVLGTVTANAEGEWSYTPTTNLVEGTHSITATATDAAGNVSEPSDSWNFILDITAPNVGISDNSADSLAGQSEPGALITVETTNGDKFTAVANEDGRWIITPNPIAAGESGKIYATDPAGNVGDPLSFQGSALASYDLLNESSQVNTTTAGDQANPTTTRLADGRIVVIWQGAGTGTDVFMQLYEADGVHKIGTEQQINQRISGNQDSAQVVALADGGFLVVYESYGGGLDNDQDGVIARRYGSDGQAMTDEFLVNVTTAGSQRMASAVATDDGGYIITWVDQAKSVVQRTYDADNHPTTGEVVVATGTSVGSSGGPEMAAFTDAAHSGMYITVWNAASGPSDNSSTGVVGQIFGADGKPLGSAFQVNTTMDASQNYPDVLTLADGSFVVYWDTNDSGANGSDIRAVHYIVDAETGKVSLQGTGDFIVNSYTTGKQYKPVGVALEDGGYLLIWGSEGGDGSGSAIYAQRFDAADHRVGREFIVNTITQGNQGTGGDSTDVTHILDATLTADGNVYVTWQSDNVDGSGMGVSGIAIDPDAAYYSEFTVNTTVTGAQTVSSVASMPDGGAIVVWQSASGDGSGSCVMGQMLDAKGQPVGGEFVVNTTTSGDQTAPQVAVLADGTFEVVWSSGSYIKGQKFTYSYDSDGVMNGVATSGAEFNVNNGTAAANQGAPVITTLEDGGYMVVWQAAVNGTWQIYGRQYDSEGAPVADQQILTSTTLSSGGFLVIADWEPLPSVTTLNNGMLAITYTVKGTGYDTAVRIYDPSTQTVGTEFIANQTLTNDQASPSVSALDNGNFVVTWDSNNNTGPDQNGYSVWGRIYDATGKAISNEFIINTATVGDQHLAKVVSRADGSFVTVFVSQTDADAGAGTYGIYAQYFDASGNKVGQQMRINQLTYGDQTEVDATFLEGGQLYVTWTDSGVGDGNGSAIKGRIVDLVDTLGLEQQTPQNDDPTLIDYQPSTVSTQTGDDTVPPNVGISANTADKLGGQTEPGVTVTVTDAKGIEHTAVADSTGAWSIEPNPLGVGDNGYISATDMTGNQSAPILISGSALDNYDLLNESAQVNTTTGNDQANPTTTRLADGRIVVIWQDTTSTGVLTSQMDVYMQLYEADGVHKIGTEQQVNQRTANNQDSAQVVALADGGFLVVYESYNGGLDNDQDGIIARRYGADGQAMTDEFLVNVTTSGGQNNPGVLATDDGGYIITWVDQAKSVVQRTYDADNQPTTGEVVVATGTSMGSSGGPEMAAFTDAAHSGMYITVWNAASGPSDTSSTGVVGQIFGADGKPLGSAFQVNTTMDASQNYPDVLTLADGSFVVYWDTNDSGANGSDIRAVHYTVDAETGKVSLQGTGDFIVNSYTTGKQYKPVGVALEDGGYLLIWGSEGGDGDGSAIYAQRFDAADHRVGREFIVNTTTLGNQGTGGDSTDVTHILDATLTADGNVYVTWQSDNVDGSGMGVEGIVIDPNAAYYSEFTVNTTTTGDQTNSQVVSLPTGGLFEVWVSASGDGSGTAIKGQMLDAKGQPVGTEFTVNTTTTGNQLTPVVLENGNIEVVWTSPGTGGANYIKGQQYTYSFDKDGNITGLTAVGAEFNISSGAGATSQQNPDVTSLDDGGYMVVWEAIVDGEYKIYARQYDVNNSPVTDEINLASTGLSTGLIGNSNGWSSLPSITQLSGGQIAITYAVKGTGYDTSVMTYDPVTHTAGTTTVVNQTTAGDQASATVSALENGNFVVTWDSSDNSGPDQSGYSVWGRIYDESGKALSNEFLINTDTAGDQHLPTVVSRADGSFVAVFISATDGDAGVGTYGIYAQDFDASGNKVGQEMQINQLTYGDQVDVSATFIEGGQLYVTWTDEGVGDGSGSAIKGRLVDLVETLGLSDVGDGVTHIDYQPAQYYLNGTEGNDALDGRGAITIDGKGGDDTIFINSTSFTSIDGGEGKDTLVWDSNNNFELGSVSSKISGIETIHMGNNAAQTLVISANDILEMTKDNGETEHVLKITGDDGDSNTSGARDTVSIDKSGWTASTSETDHGVTYDVYVHNDDTTVKLMVQHGLNVV